MKVCIARNAEARTNASLARISDALSTETICILSRNRYSEEKHGINKKQYILKSKIVDNFEIVLKSTPGRGFINIFQLVSYQIRVLIWFIRNMKKYDIIHAFDLDVGLPAYLISKVTKKKYVYHIADFYVDSRKSLPLILKSFIRSIEIMVINNSVATIVCTEDRIKQIKGSNPKKITVIHNTPIISKETLDALKVKEEKKIVKNSIIFTYVGNLESSRFIESALKIVKDYPQIKLEIAGMGTSEEFVKDMSRRYDNINYYGMIDYKEALKLYSKTDFMFALYDPKVPNHKFSAPNKVYEAMILGKPIIIAKNTGIDKIVNENNMGYVIDYSEKAFKELVNKIIDSPEEWEELSRNSETSYEKYSWPIMRKRVNDLYKDISKNYLSN